MTTSFCYCSFDPRRQRLLHVRIRSQIPRILPRRVSFRISIKRYRTIKISCTVGISALACRRFLGLRNARMHYVTSIYVRQTVAIIAERNVIGLLDCARFLESSRALPLSKMISARADRDRRFQNVREKDAYEVANDPNFQGCEHRQASTTRLKHCELA